MSSSFCAAVALALLSPAVQAMSINPAGTGQVLLYPCYTVNAGLVTQISLTNASDRGKALRVRFAEGHNDRYELSFSLYIASTVPDADLRTAQPHRAISACSRHNSDCR